MKKRINVAVIGVGNMGKHHTRVYSELEEANLVAISEVNEREGKRIAEEYNCHFYKDYKDMLEKEKIDAVSIASPTSLHKNIALHCIVSGKHILIEKPIASSWEDGETIVQEAKKQNVILTVGHVERFNPAVQRLKEMICKGRFGKIISIDAKRVGIFPPQIKDADVIIDLAVHDIDVCNFLLGKRPHRVYAKAGKALHSERSDFTSILLEYNDINVLIQANWITPVKIRELTITGTKGYAELDYITQKLKVYESVYEKKFDSFGDFVIKFGEPGIKDIRVKTVEPLKAELEHFVSCVRDEGSPLVSGGEALWALKIALTAIDSYNNDKIMEVNGDL